MTFLAQNWDFHFSSGNWFRISKRTSEMDSGHRKHYMSVFFMWIWRLSMIFDFWGPTVTSDRKFRSMISAPGTGKRRELLSAWALHRVTEVIIEEAILFWAPVSTLTRNFYVRNAARCQGRSDQKCDIFKYALRGSLHVKNGSQNRTEHIKNIICAASKVSSASLYQFSENRPRRQKNVKNLTFQFWHKKLSG